MPSKTLLLILGVCASVHASVYAASAQAQTFAPSQRPKLAEGYTRYVTPGQCIAAVKRETWAVWRDPDLHDTLAYTVDLKQEMIPPSAMRGAQQCLEHLQTARLRQNQHVGMLQLALLARHDKIARQFLDSAKAGVATESDPEARSWLLVRLIETYLDPQLVDPLTSDKSFATFGSEPLRYAESLKHLLAIIPCDNTIMCSLRVQVWGTLRQDARARGDFSAAMILSDSLIATRRELNSMYPDKKGFFQGLSYLFDDMNVTLGPASIPPAWERLRQRLSETGANPEDPFPEDALANRFYFIRDSLFRFGMQVKFPVLTPKAWIGRTGTVSAPAAGRVRLVIHVPVGMRYSSYRGNFPEVTAMFRRLEKRYASSGLDIIWIMDSQGHFLGNSVLTFDKECQAIASYWFEHNNAPGIIAFDEAPFLKRPDGKVLPRPTNVASALNQFQSRMGGMPGNVYLVDRGGNLVTTVHGMRAERDSEAELARFIERVLGGIAESEKDKDKN